MRDLTVSVRELLVLSVVAVLSVSSCSTERTEATTVGPASTTGTPPATEITSVAAGAALLEVPDDARVATGDADPRGSSYWIQWSTCGEDSQADVAAANGGSAAGWVLLDDVLADPGIAVGDHVLASCDAAIDLLTATTTESDSPDDLAYALAGQLLTAQLNLNVGAETCPAAEESVVAAHIVLSSIGFDGVRSHENDQRVGSDAPAAAIAELLAAYNSGVLCE